MSAASGDLLGVTCVMMPSGFNVAAIVVDEGTPDTRYLRGVPSAVPRPRKRAAVREVSGYGLVPVMGAGRLTGEAALSGTLLVEVDGFGRLIAEAHRLLIVALYVGAEAVLAGEAYVRAFAAASFSGVARLCGEHMVSSVGVVAPFASAMVRRDRMIGGRLAIRSGGEAAITAYESDEQVALMLLGLPSELGA